MEHKHRSYPIVSCFALTWLIIFSSLSSIRAEEKDLQGSSDHPLIQRYGGSVIIGYEVKDYDEFILPLGKQTRDAKNAISLAKSRKIEGKIKRILYMSPAGRSTLEVYRNYQDALNKAGFETLFACSGNECGAEGMLGEYVLYSKMNPDRTLKNNETAKYALSMPKDQRYLSASRSRPEGDVYVSLYVAYNGIDLALLRGKPVVLLEVIEVKPMTGNMVKVDAGEWEKEIRKTGRVAVYSLFFDTDKSDIKSESEPTLREIAKLLTNNPKLRLYVTGHTDNVGTLTHNLDLSKRRAEAVVKALVSKHGIDAKRLHPAGFGPMSPVASNGSEDGRSKNRRVELVEQ